MSLRNKIAARNSKRNQARAVNTSDPVGSVGLWYGSGKVVFNGTITFGDYRDDDAVKYSVLIFEPDEPKKYIYSGIVILPKKKGIKGKRERSPKVGSIYIYESHKQSAYMMIYLDTDVEGESEVFACPLVESDSTNPKSCALFGKIYEANDKQHEDSDKNRVAKAQKVLKGNQRKEKADSWYTDLEPKDLITIIKSYKEEKFLEFFELFQLVVSLVDEIAETSTIDEDSQPHSVDIVDEEEELDPGYEVVDESDDDDDEEVNEDYEQDNDTDEEEEEVELPHETPKNKLRIKDITNKSKGGASKSLINRVSSEFFEGLGKADIQDLI